MILSRINCALKQHSLTDSRFPVKLSMGLATSENAGQSLEETLARADQLMYLQKSSRSVSRVSLDGPVV